MLQDITALICMSLMGFSAWWTIGPRGCLKSCNFFHWLHCTPKLKETAFSIAVYIQDRLEMKLGPRKPLFYSYLIAKGTKKRDAPSAARKGGGGGENEQLQYQIMDKDRNETGQTNKDLR